MNTNLSNIAVVIMAAGASNRMGRPKQLLKWGNSTLINHSINTVLNIRNQEIIVVLGAYFYEVKKEIEQQQVTVLNNEQWHDGLGKSIACAAQYILDSKLKIDGLLFVLADQPLIDSNYLDKMIQRFTPNRNQIIATSYVNNKKGVPVLFDKKYLEDLSELSDDNGAKKLLKMHHLNVTVQKSESENLDIDSEEDYENLYNSNFKT